MWRLTICGVVVQLVLLASILDVSVYDGDTGVRLIGHKPCLKNFMVVVIEGLQVEDILLAAKEFDSVRNLLQAARVFQVEYSANGSRHEKSKDSVFDDKPVLYVGPAYMPQTFNTCLWDFVLNYAESNRTSIKNFSSFADVNQLNHSELFDESITDDAIHYESYVVNSYKIIDHIKKIIDTPQLDFYPVKFVHIGPQSAYDYLPSSEERAWILHKVFEVIANASRSFSYAFAIVSSMNMLVRNSTVDELSEDAFILFKNQDCFSASSLTNSTIDYDQAYHRLRSLVALTSFKKEINIRGSLGNFFIIDGNILEFIGFRAFEVQALFRNADLYVSGWETVQAVFRSLDFAEIDINPMVLTSTIFIFGLWISYLSIKTAKLAVDWSPSFEGLNTTSKFQFLNVFCLVLLAFLCVTSKCAGYPCRYSVYFFTMVVVLRLFIGEVMSLIEVNFSCSNTDRVKVFLQVIILVSVVECLFWSIKYPKVLFILFVLAVSARILQASFSVVKFRTILVFSVSAFTIALQYLWPFTLFGSLTNVNLTAVLGLAMGIASIKFLMNKSNRDRFVMFICLVELVMATCLVDVFLSQSIALSRIIPTVAFFMCFSVFLPLFGGSDPKNRLLELAVATTAVYTFFSCKAEGIFLLASFSASFCTFMMDRAFTKKLLPDDSYYLNVFPALFHVILIILASHVVSPAGGEAIITAYTFLSAESSMNVVASGVFYFMKVIFLVNLLQATFLASGEKSLEIPMLLIVVVILNLISFRSFVHHVLSSQVYGLRDIFVNHILLHFVAAMSFYLYPFYRVLCKANLLRPCESVKTYVPQEPVH